MNMSDKKYDDMNMSDKKYDDMNMSDKNMTIEYVG
jgi:hypothetical protein